MTISAVTSASSQQGARSVGSSRRIRATDMKENIKKETWEMHMLEAGVVALGHDG